MPNRKHVNAELVASASLWQESNPRPREAVWIGCPREHFVGRQTGLPLRLMHDLPRAPKRLLTKRSIDVTAVVGEMPGNKGFVHFLDLARLEEHRQRPVGRCVSRKDKHPRSIAIKPMHNARAWKVILQTRDETICLFRPNAGHGEQPRHLVDGDKKRVMEEDCVAGESHEDDYTNRPCFPQSLEPRPYSLSRSR